MLPRPDARPCASLTSGRERCHDSRNMRGLLCGSSDKSVAGRQCYQHECGTDTGLGPSTPEWPWPTQSKAAPPSNVAPKLAIVDTLKLPADLATGEYVLQWRWDCEETAQGKLKPASASHLVDFAPWFSS